MAAPGEPAGVSAHTAAAGLAGLFLASSLFAQNVALRLLLLLLSLLLGAYVALRGRRELTLLPGIWLPFALWAAWAAASLAWSIEPERSLKEWRNEIFYTSCALWSCFIAAQARAAPRLLPHILAAGALAVCGISIWEYSRGRQEYLTGWHGGPGDHSNALLLLMPCAVMAGWYARRAGAGAWPVVAAGALAATFFVSAYATLNRTIWIGFAVQFAVLGTFLALRGRASLKLAAAGAALLAALAVLFVAAQDELQETKRPRAARAPKADTRVALWPEVAAHIAERPLTGHGFGRGLLRAELQEKLRGVDRNLWHAHNIFLDAALQTGLAGLALFVALLGAIVRAGWRYARSADDGVAACGIVLIALVAGMLVRNMTDTLLARQNALLFWGLVGVLLAWGTRRWRA
jgi:O-antigen ligase